MNANTKPYPSTMLAPALVEEMTEEGNNNGYTTPPKKFCGYTLIDGHLVPETFIQLVKEEISGCIFSYGAVLTLSDIFDEEFLELLVDSELAVLMPVVLQLIARDEFPLCLWDSNDQDHECEEVAA